MRMISSSMPRPDNTWVTQVRPSSAESILGSCGRQPNPPLRSTWPAFGSLAPPSTLNRLVLPAPLRPTMPTFAPGHHGEAGGVDEESTTHFHRDRRAWSIRPGYGNTFDQPLGVADATRHRCRFRIGRIGRIGRSGHRRIGHRRIGHRRSGRRRSGGGRSGHRRRCDTGARRPGARRPGARRP